MPDPINEFFAVTRTSIYHVEAHGEYRASAKKIALRSESAIGIGEDLAEGGMIAVGRCLLGYIPEKYGMAHPMTGYERNPMQINTRWWRGQTSPIVGLFKDKDTAMACFNEASEQPYDERWRDSTGQVLADIGDEHPSLFMMRNGPYAMSQQQAA